MDIKRPDYKEIEYYFKCFERPSASQSKDLMDYSHHLETIVTDMVQVLSETVLPYIDPVDDDVLNPVKEVLEKVEGLEIFKEEETN